jgi:hypothetical protein
MKTLIRSLAVGLVLGFAASSAWGQPQHQEAVGGHGYEAHSQPQAAAPDIPLNDLDRGMPRRAVVGFRQAVRARLPAGREIS